jgi:hypothetical protein
MKIASWNIVAVIVRENPACAERPSFPFYHFLLLSSRFSFPFFGKLTWVRMEGQGATIRSTVVSGGAEQSLTMDWTHRMRREMQGRSKSRVDHCCGAPGIVVSSARGGGDTPRHGVEGPRGGRPEGLQRRLRPNMRQGWRLMDPAVLGYERRPWLGR